MQTRRLLTNADPTLPTEQAERVIAAAEGNPLFAEHLAALVGDNDTPGGLPRSIQVLLSARVEALPAPEREVVSVAAVAGRDFPVAAVEALMGRPIADELDLLAQLELIEPTAAGRQQFGHALLQEAAYGLIPKGRRSELHIRLARWIDENGAGDALVGDHLERAFVLRSELGLADAATAGIGEEAGARLAAAGRRADALGDPRRARRLLERALGLLPEKSPGHAAAAVELAAAGWNLLPIEEVERLLSAGVDLAAELGLRALELRARILRMGAAPEGYVEPLGDRGVLSETNAALRELEALDDPRALASALCTRANVECALGRAAAAVASASRALDVLRAAEEDTVWALENLVWAVIESPMPIPAVEALLAQLLDELGVRPTVRSELIQGQAELAQLRGEAEEAWRLLGAAQEIERDLGRNQTPHLLELRGAMLVRAGRCEEARAVLKPAIAEMERRRDQSSAVFARCWLALAEVRVGSLDAARATTIVLQDDTARGGWYEARTRTHLVLSELHLAEGDTESAVAEAREAAEIAASGDWVLLNAEARLTLARALHAAGDPAAAAEQAGTAAGLCRVKGYVAGIAGAEAPALPVVS